MNNWNKEVVESLEVNAFYHNGKPLQRESDNYLIEIIREETEKGSKILDYASGTGRFLHLLMQECVSTLYTGYDSSPDMVEKAKEKFPENIFINDLEGKTFDVAVNIDMLQHSTDLKSFVGKMKEVLKVSKKVLFHFWYEDHFKYQEIGLKGEVFPEIFPSPVNIINDILPEFSEHKVKVKLFPNCQPYKTAVIVVEQDALPEIEEVKAEVKEEKKAKKK